MPSTKLIEFRLREDDTYYKRYSSLVELIKSENQTRFDEFTSAFLLYHVDSAQTLFTRLLDRSEMYTNGADMLCVLDLETHEVAHIGLEQSATLDFVLSAGKQQLGNALGQRSGAQNAIAQALFGYPAR